MGRTMHTYTFPNTGFGALNGKVYHSYIQTTDAFWKRLKRLDLLRVLVEQHDCEESNSICRKAIRAYNNRDNFTGIIRLSPLEKDWLSYFLESDMYDKEDIECINFYLNH